MANIKHYINNKDLGNPRNWQELEVVVDWLNDGGASSLSIENLSFVDEANGFLQDRILNGLDGGPGIFEGEPYKVEIEQGTDKLTFDGYLDFTGDLTKIGSEELTCKLNKTHSSEWLNDKIDSFSFRYLYEEKVIQDSDFVKVPYVINYIPDGVQLMVLSISIFMMTKELVENIYAIEESVASFINAATPNAGLGITVDVGDVIWAGLKVIARIAYTIAITIAIVNLIKDLFDQILQKKRNHLGIKFSTMFKRSCDHLGLGFKSDLLNNTAVKDWVYIPTKDKKGGSKNEVGIPGVDSPISTFGDLIRECKQMFNADYRIINGVFVFERLDSFKTPSTFKIPDIFNNQDRLLDNVAFNTDEIASNYNIKFSFDVQDQNTLDDQDGRVFQAITEPVSIRDKELVLLKDSADVSIPFSLGKAKTGLTDVEKLAKALGSITDKVTGIFGKGTRFKSKIENRVGALNLSSHFISVPKIVSMSGGKLHLKQREKISTRFLWDNFHFINSFVTINGKHNQFWRYSDLRIPLSFEDFLKILDNNIGTTDSGETYEIELIRWIPESGTATIDYRINKKYTNNLKIKYV